MLNTQFSPWPKFTDEEAEKIQQVLLSNKVNYWTGNECRQFEEEFASWCGSSFAIAVSNGTLALELALKCLGIGPGDEVIVTPRTFLASVSCVITVGATPVFADINPNSQNINAESIATVLTPRTRAIVCVHLAGYPCEMDEIMEIAGTNNLFVIEDCAQAHGASYKGKSVGSIGHIGAWSFCQDKIMTTGGEGGMVTTNDKGLWETMWSYKDHGKSWKAIYEKKHPQGFRWLHESFGSNYRMTEIQAAIGRIQLKKMLAWNTSRTENASIILDTCRDFRDALRVPTIPEYIHHAWYKCYVFINSKGLKKGWNRDLVIDAINADGVPCYQGSCSEVYLEKAFDETRWRPKERLKYAKELGETSMMFLVHPSLKDSEVRKTCNVIENIMNQASI